MTLRTLIKDEFGIDLLISGGFGNSIDNPIIIQRTAINNYVGTEYLILNCLGERRGIDWEMIQQELLFHDDRILDRIEIETKETATAEILTQIEEFYFDITECFGSTNKENSEFDEI